MSIVFQKKKKIKHDLLEEVFTEQSYVEVTVFLTNSVK